MQPKPKYNDILTRVRKETEADGALLIIINGNKGNGCAQQLKPEVIPAIAMVLRAIADDLEIGNWPNHIAEITEEK